MTAEAAHTRITEMLRAAGLVQGGRVLVHSSLSSLGQVLGGAETVVRGLLDAVGPKGTLLVPALSYIHVNADRPIFDVMKTPSNVGAIPEHFRTRAGTLRSLSPTHSVCGLGPDAEGLLKDHHLDDTPCGNHSPYRRLYELDGQVVFLGCGLRPNTSMHGVEELVVPPYLFGPAVTYQVIRPDKSRMQVCCKAHDFTGVEQRYDRLEALLGEGELRSGKVLGATVQLIGARVMWDRALAALKGNPLFFVEKR